MKKRKPVIAICLLIIFLMILGFLSYIFFYNMKNPPVNRDEFSDQLNTMGKDIYEEYYYEITKVDKTEAETKDFLSKFNTIGLQFNLVELSKYKDEYKDQIANFLNSNKSCSREGTKVIIYPKEPYSKTDYIIETKVDCNQKDKK